VQQASHRQPSLVGRLPELAALDEIVGSVRRGGRLAVVEGEAGIGKTRLVEAALENARGAGAAVLSSRAEELEAHRPFGAILDCVGGERLDEQLAAWDLRPDAGASASSASPRPSSSGSTSSARAVPSSWRSRTSTGPIRPPSGSSRGSRPASIAFRPRSWSARGRSRGDPSSSGSSPFSRRAGRRACGCTRSTKRRPSSCFLEPDVLDLLGLASVLGASFAAADLSLLAGRPMSELVAVLRSAQRAGVLGEQGDRLAFRHDLIRDALYEDMALSVRRGLHAELARALADAGEPTERVAEHLVRAAAPGDERAIGSLVAAARDLVGRGPGAAVDLYHEAIALSADPPARRAQLLPELAEALVSAGLLGEGEAACREALAGDLDGEWAGRLGLHLMFLLTRRARTAEAVREREAGLATADLGERDRERLRAFVAMSRVFEGEVERALRDARAVLETSGDEIARALATNTRAMAAYGRSSFAEAAELIAPNVRWARPPRRRGAGDGRCAADLPLPRGVRRVPAREPRRRARRAGHARPAGRADGHRLARARRERPCPDRATP
jgi:hypothetical protein